ncbi:MAG TPA: hypothetical protein VJZ91_06210 [Blastocatellia bacterium]|nr:hypothetical protein [Blastocatellia bacterium]
MSEKPSYVKEAAKEPMNIWAIVLILAMAVFAATNPGLLGTLMTYWVLAAGGVAEALYLMTVPSLTSYKRAVDRRYRQKELADRQRRREELILKLDPRHREAVEYLRWTKNQIYQNFQKFTKLTDLPEQIRTLDLFWERYVDFLDTYQRRKQHMRSINRQMIQNQINQAQRAIETAPDDDTARLYSQHLEFLQKRMKTYDDVERSIKRVEAQLQSIESYFGLVNDQVITMPTPDNISSLDFDSLLSSIELTREILDETAPVLSQWDAQDRDSSSPVRPPIPQRQ